MSEDEKDERVIDPITLFEEFFPPPANLTPSLQTIASKLSEINGNIKRLADKIEQSATSCNDSDSHTVVNLGIFYVWCKACGALGTQQRGGLTAWEAPQRGKSGGL